MNQFARIAAFVIVAAGNAASADGYTTPARGSDLRQDLMDAIRPIAEWEMGPPVVFSVDDLRVAGKVAFAALQPVRPSGADIPLSDTRMSRQDDFVADFFDGTFMYVLFQKSGRMWVASQWSVGATDVWFADPELCAVFRTVTPEFCL